MLLGIDKSLGAIVEHHFYSTHLTGWRCKEQLNVDVAHGFMSCMFTAQYGHFSDLSTFFYYYQGK